MKRIVVTLAMLTLVGGMNAMNDRDLDAYEFAGNRTQVERLIRALNTVQPGTAQEVIDELYADAQEAIAEIGDAEGFNRALRNAHRVAQVRRAMPAAVQPAPQPAPAVRAEQPAPAQAHVAPQPQAQPKPAAPRRGGCKNGRCGRR